MAVIRVVAPCGFVGADRSLGRTWNVPPPTFVLKMAAVWCPPTSPRGVTTRMTDSRHLGAVRNSNVFCQHRQSVASEGAVLQDRQVSEESGPRKSGRWARQGFPSLGGSNGSHVRQEDEGPGSHRNSIWEGRARRWRSFRWTRRNLGTRLLPRVRRRRAFRRRRELVHRQLQRYVRCVTPLPSSYAVRAKYRQIKSFHFPVLCSERKNNVAVKISSTNFCNPCTGISDRVLDVRTAFTSHKIIFTDQIQFI